MKYVILVLMVALLNGCNPVPKTGNTQAAQANCDTTGNPFGGGTGSVSEPWLICTVDQLKRISGAYNVDNFKLTANLDLSAATWVSLPGFVGKFDGQGYTIANLSGTQGLFVQLAGGTIENLVLTNVNVQGGSGVGAVTGYMNAGGLINSVHILSGLVKGTSKVGGIVGESYGTVAFSTSQATITLAGGVNSRAGGIVGISQSGGVVTDSNANGTVSGGTQMGRVIGNNLGGAARCYYAGFTSSPMVPIGNNQGGADATCL